MPASHWSSQPGQKEVGDLSKSTSGWWSWRQWLWQNPTEQTQGDPHAIRWLFCYRLCPLCPGHVPQQGPAVTRSGWPEELHAGSPHSVPGSHAPCPLQETEERLLPNHTPPLRVTAAHSSHKDRLKIAKHICSEAFPLLPLPPASCFVTSDVPLAPSSSFLSQPAQDWDAQVFPLFSTTFLKASWSQHLTHYLNCILPGIQASNRAPSCPTRQFLRVCNSQ